MDYSAKISPLKVVVWSTGTVGKHAIAGVVRHPDLDLVGVWVSSDAKAGRDVGELANLGRDIGVIATTDRQALFDLKPDAIIHCAMTDDRTYEAVDDLIDFVDAGINVVSSGPVVMLTRNSMVPDESWDRLEAAGRRTGASLHVNGIDPGWANDILPLQMSSLSQRIDHVRVSEIADYSTYYQPVVMRELFGFGDAVDAEKLLWMPGILSAGWGPVVRVIAKGLGLTLDEPLTEVVDRRPSDRDLSTASVEIAAGTMGAVRFQVIGCVDGVPRVTLEHVTRTAVDQMPEWPQPDDGGGCYRVEIDGEPCMKLEFTHHGEHGDHNVSGMIVTAQRLVNSVRAVVAAEPGLVTALDLPLVTGRGLVAGKQEGS